MTMSINTDDLTTLMLYAFIGPSTNMFEAARHQIHYVYIEGDPGKPVLWNSTDVFDSSSVFAPFIDKYMGMNGWSWFLYSLILSDLGQSVDWNIFHSTQLLSSVYDATYSYATNGSAEQNDTHTRHRLYIVDLPGVQPATISKEYFCQIPKLESMGSLIVSIMAADLVFLQAFWMIFTFTTTYFLARRHPEAMSCATCARKRITYSDDEDGPVLDNRMTISETGGDYSQARTTDELERISSPISPAAVLSLSRHECDRGNVEPRSIPSIRG